jgi:hypothetical protein
MKRSICLRLQNWDVLSVEDWAMRARLLSYTIFGVDKGGVDRVIISSSPSALAIIVEMKEFTDSEPRASQSTTDLQNKTCLTT